MGNGPAIVIEGTREDWPGGCQILTPLDPNQVPNHDAFRFGAQVEPAGIVVWFRIAHEAIERMRENASRRRGARFVDALLTRHRDGPACLLEGVNYFHVCVSDAGDVTVEAERDDE